MGLLAEKQSRSRISKDPNNTRWTRDTKTFGQKILRAQGWEPGQFLGAQDASHSELHTAANASYIRVALKDDMKGLGYNRAKEDEVTGLDVFSDLLSRLNGKSEESVDGDRQARLVVKTNRYVEAKWGPMRFVRGGLLVGDEMQAESASEEEPTPTSEVDDKSKKSKRDKKNKKRKAADLEESESESASAGVEKKEKKRRKEERRAKKLAAAAETEDKIADDERQAKKRSKKDKSKSRAGSGAEDESVDSKRSKKDKKEKRQKKRKTEETETEKEDSSSATASVPTSAVTTGTSTPIGSGTGTSTPRGSRNFVRSRFIAQKKQAVLDTKALAQIFMVKT